MSLICPTCDKLLLLRGPNAFEEDVRRLDAEAELGRVLGELKPQEEQVVR